METINKFNKRTFFSIGMLVSGIGLPISGLFNHYLAFGPLSVERHFWMSVHNISGILFTIFTISHIIMNRRAIVKHIHSLKGVLINKEALAAVAVVFFITVLFASHAFLAGRGH